MTDKPAVDLLSVSVDPDWSLTLHVSLWASIAIVILIAGYVVWRWYNANIGWRDFEIDQAEVGVGTGKLTLRPNMTDRQVAYSIWVELSTRKIGLPIDFENDVIAEIFDSWHTFFTITREMIKSIPVSKVRHDSTQKIVALSIEILNEGLRPHLTMWQARFRRWYETELSRANKDEAIDPQEIQRKYPRWAELKVDTDRVNQHLIAYRKKLELLVRC